MLNIFVPLARPVMGPPVRGLHFLMSGESSGSASAACSDAGTLSRTKNGVTLSRPTSQALVPVRSPMWFRPDLPRVANHAALIEGASTGRALPLAAGPARRNPCPRPMLSHRYEQDLDGSLQRVRRACLSLLCVSLSTVGACFAHYGEPGSGCSTPAWLEPPPTTCPATAPIDEKTACSVNNETCSYSDPSSPTGQRFIHLVCLHGTWRRDR